MTIQLTHDAMRAALKRIRQWLSFRLKHERGSLAFGFAAGLTVGFLLKWII